MHWSNPSDQAAFDAKHSGLGVLVCYPNQKNKSAMLLKEIRQALREGRTLFMVGPKKPVDGKPKQG